MRRFLSLFTMLMLCGVLAFAQSRVVSGRVTDNAGRPVPFATVLIKGGNTGVQTDVNGEFSIRVNSGDVLVISQTSYDGVEVPVGSSNSIATTLTAKTNSIPEVIVTGAFNTRRTARSTASNVQNVGSEQLNTIRQTNVNNALAGKIAGAQVRSQSAAALGRETIVRLRGENGIGIGGGALYVVDGTIIPSSNDINPDDIEDVTVLQGPAAAALFGPEGANGAIVINTKKARKGQKGLGIELNSSVTFDQVYILPDYQNAYAGGQYADMSQFHYIAGFHPAGWAALDGKYYPDYQEDVSWGPRMVGQEYIPWYSWYGGHERSFTTAKLTPQPNNAKDYFNTGVTKLNNVSFSKGGDNYSFRASYTRLDQTGVVPASYLKKNTFNMSASIDLSSKFTLGANINYLNQISNSENDDTYSNNTTGQFNQWFHRDLDMNILRDLRNFKTPEGILASWNHANPDLWDPARPVSFYGSYYWFSPYSYQDNISNTGQRDRLFGDASIQYKVNNDLKLKFTYRKNQLTTNSETYQANALQNSIRDNLAGFNYWEQVARRAAPWGGYAIGYSTSNRQNYEFLSTYHKKVRDFEINANAGLDILKTEQRVFNANTMGGLILPDLYLLSNSKNPISSSNQIFKSGRRSLFVRADVGFRNYLFVEGTFRKDYSSTEAPGFSIDTKSAGVSFVFSDLINKNGSTFLSYGKVRGSMGQILNTLGIYDNSSLYSVNQFQFGANGINNFLQTEPDRQIDPTVHGAVNDEKEIGLELRFLKNRLGISTTYWDRTNKDFPFNASISGFTGYTSIYTNAGEVKKTGLDVQLMFIPVRTKNVDWTINATWGRLLENKVVSIGPGIERVTLGSGQSGTSAYLVSQVGQSWGQLRGIGFKRVNGQPVLKANGDYDYQAEVNFGSTLPMYTGGVQNSLTLFKNFVVNVNIDYSYGGKFFSLSEWYGHATGLMAATATLNDKGNSIRDAVADGGGVHVFGVDATGKPVDQYVEGRHYWEQFAYGDGIAEPFVKDLTFVKLRELSIGYKLPMERLTIGKYIKSATFSVIARNPWLIYTKAKGFDPSEISTAYGEDGQLPGTRGIGVNLKLGF
jgi:TonB-linked SusC/RagA family outer membrane protein